MLEVIIFGMGKFYQNVKAELCMKYKVVAFLDNKIKQSQKEYLEDEKVYAYNPVEIEKAGAYPIIIMVKNIWEIYNQFLDMGIDEKRLLFGLEFFPMTWSEKLAFSGEGHLLVEGGKIVFQSNNKCVVLDNREMYENCIKKYAFQKYKEQCPYIDIIAGMPTVPASRAFGSERGKPIDRYYIENFLDDNKQYIRGETLEIAETTYSLKYGEDRISHAYMLHVKGWGEDAIKGNFETGEGIEVARYDTLIITQTLMFIYDVKSVAENIYKTLKYGGTAFITVAGISQIARNDADRWGSYYGFHEDAMHRLFEPLFGKKNVEEMLALIS